MVELICPVCRARGIESPLRREKNSLYCEKRHCFDVAKSGYATLTAAPGTSGDDREMVRARTAFLDSGAYRLFAEALTERLPPDGVIVDAGCGEGYYTNLFALASPDAEVCGFDLSKHACEHAAKRARASQSGAFFGTASIFSLPVASSSCAAVVSVFAPIAEAEFARVLRPGGLLIVGAAGKRHLIELKRAVYDEVYENEGRRDLPEGFEPVDGSELSYSFVCEGENIKRLFSMTPYAFRTSREDAAKLDSLTALEITADFDIFVYRKK